MKTSTCTYVLNCMDWKPLVILPHNTSKMRPQSHLPVSQGSTWKGLDVKMRTHRTRYILPSAQHLEGGSLVSMEKRCTHRGSQSGLLRSYIKVLGGVVSCAGVGLHCRRRQLVDAPESSSHHVASERSGFTCQKIAGAPLFHRVLLSNDVWNSAMSIYILQSPLD